MPVRLALGVALAGALVACGEGRPPPGLGGVDGAQPFVDSGSASAPDSGGGFTADAGGGTADAGSTSSPDAAVAVPDAGPYVPSNAALFGAWRDTGIRATASGTFSTSSQCAAGAVLGECEVRGGACVCRADTLALGDLRVTGSRPLVLLVRDRATVSGVLDLSGVGSVPGAGSSPSDSAGGSSLAGAPGGSHAMVGGSGGGASAGTHYPAAVAYGTATLSPLQAGTSGDSYGSTPGGGGGGALQLSAGVELTVTGSVRANGGGGAAGTSSSLGGGGGGSGGALLLEAPALRVSGGLYANGGGGGGAGRNGDGSGTRGEDGRAGLSPASGGYGEDGHGCALGGYTSGGNGGSGGALSAGPGAGSTGDSVTNCFQTARVGGGGGGGAPGRIRLNGTCDCQGSYSPLPSFGPLR